MTFAAEAQDWLDTFDLAGIAAFWCRRNADAFETVSRTGCFGTLVSGPDAVVDEATLLNRLAAARLAAQPGEVLMIREAAEAWHCVAQPMADLDHFVAIMRLPSPRQLRNEHFFSIVEQIPDVIGRFDRSLRFLYVNPAVEQADPERTVHLRIGRSHGEIGSPAALVDLWQSAYRTIFETGERIEREFEFPSPDGPRHFVLRMVPELGADGQIQTVLSSACDVTELKSLQREMEVLAQTDSLTPLLNRRAFTERANVELLKVYDGQGRLSVLLLDVDDFKGVNDTYGHLVGDQVLVGISSVLQEEIGPYDFAARMGGDEFCVGFVGADVANAGEIGERIRWRIGHEVAPNDLAVDVRVSIGLTAATSADSHLDQVMGRADRLMYEEKLGKRRRSRSGRATDRAARQL